MPEAITPRAEDTFIRGYRQLALETPARRRDALLRVLDVLLSAFFLLLALPLALPIALIVLAYEIRGHEETRLALKDLAAALERGDGGPAVPGAERIC